MSQRRLITAVLILLVMLASAVPAFALPIEQPSLDGIHVVQAGETLSSIALRYGVTVQALMTANGIDNALSLIHISEPTRPY